MASIASHRKAALLAMGFASYRAYLASDLWEAIRNRVLARDKYCCRRCGENANQVHHTHYWPEVLRGEDDSYLVALCRFCHQSIEFDGNGEKKPLSRVLNRDFGFHESLTTLHAPATDAQKESLAKLYEQQSGAPFDLNKFATLTFGRWKALSGRAHAQLHPKKTKKRKERYPNQHVPRHCSWKEAVKPATEKQKNNIRDMHITCNIQLDEQRLAVLNRGNWQVWIAELYATAKKLKQDAAKTMHSEFAAIVQ